MNYRFELNRAKRNSNGLIPIRAVISEGKLRIRKNVSGVKCLEQDWDFQSYHIKMSTSSDFTEYYEDANSELQKFKDRLREIKRYLIYNKIPLTKELFEAKFNPNDIICEKLFWEAFNEFIKVSIHTKSNSTIKSYKTLKNKLLEFEVYANFHIDFDAINQNFEEKFMDYSFNHKGHLNNYYSKLIKNLKTFMRWAYEKGYHENLSYQKLKRIENDIEVIHLSKDELFTLYNYQFHSKRLERARDMFCFACFTGLRYSDLKSISSNNIVNGSLQFNVIKTKSIDHRFKLNKYALEIIDKYKGTVYEPYPKLSGQKLNKYIQECCQIIGMNDIISITRYQGAKSVHRTYKKYELITCHVARKTFVTLSLTFGMNERVIRSITNHTDEKSFRKYVRISNAMKSKEIENSWNAIER